MKAGFDCIPCIIRQTIEAARIGAVPEIRQRQIINRVLGFLQEADYDVTPPMLGREIHRILTQEFDMQDPYRAHKENLNRFALERYTELKKKVYLSDDPVYLAAKLAISGNLLNIDNEHPAEQIWRLIENAHLLEFRINDFPLFLEDFINAGNILYLADNAGEIVFDRLFIEVLQRFYPERNNAFTVVVRGAPIINDATMEDARLVDMQKIATVIDNGDDAPATLLGRVSSEMRRYYETADLVISKGQGNYESLNEEKKLIYFMFRVKCPVISKVLAVPEGSLIMKRSGTSEIRNISCDTNKYERV
jgi:uncharacterized protein with ATP-grasp and redox domains